ncbi:MAG: helix-turn-helix transcriptional regulator [Gammaproteobacteria bacterium]|nr:helix-turn-helix transcriptional regulator [Gammaproteobacteria bacterium]
MSQTESLINTLKRMLRMRGITYRNLAEELAMSEASIKRLFSTKHVSLERMERICEVAQISLADLVKQMDMDMRTVDELSEEQEQEITADHGLLLATFLVINGWQFSEMLEHYTFTQHQLVHHLATLDRLRLIELLPKNRFYLLISPHFAWRKNGPIQKFFSENLQRDFLNSRFTSEDELLLFPTAMLTTASRNILKQRLEDLAKEFNELKLKDKGLPLEQRQLTSLILAVRPWRVPIFEKYLRSTP